MRTLLPVSSSLLSLLSLLLLLQPYESRRVQALLGALVAFLDRQAGEEVGQSLVLIKKWALVKLGVLSSLYKPNMLAEIYEECSQNKINE
jgi:hypothetical protein